LKRSDNLLKIGIIAEFNPLHNGHKYLISEAKKHGDVICVMSGNFVQRGDLSIYPKETRFKAALGCGCDLVVELPTPWAMSTAQNFAFGSIYILNSLGCDTIMFGSECGAIEPLLSVANILESEDFSSRLTDELKKGITFAKARENAVKSCGGDSSLLSLPNNTLAIEYILAARKINKELNFKTIKRLGAMHDTLNDDVFVSATLLREKIKNNDLEFLKNHTPEITHQIYEKSPVCNIEGKDLAVLSLLRSKSESDFKNLPDISEGIDNKLYNNIRLATSLEELYNSIKVKRYTHARIRRLVLCAALGIDNTFFLKNPPYIRIGGMNKIGEKIVKNAAKSSPIPIVVKPSQIVALDDFSKKLFELENRATDLYNLFLSKPQKCGSEYTRKIIKTE